MRSYIYEEKTDLIAEVQSEKDEKRNIHGKLKKLESKKKKKHTQIKEKIYMASQALHKDEKIKIVRLLHVPHAWKIKR